MSNRYKLIIFDWDGTVMDSTARIVSSMQKMAVACDLTEPTGDDVRGIIGLSLPVAFSHLFGELSDDLHAVLKESYREHYVELDTTPSPLFENAKQVLTTLRQRGSQLAIATGKAQQGLHRVLKDSDTTHFFDFIRCADQAQSKPHPDMLEQLLSISGTQIEHAVMIGDTAHDMKMAESIGMDRIAVDYGAHPVERMRPHNPKHIISRFDQLLDLV